MPETESARPTSTIKFPTDLSEMLDLICRWKGIARGAYVGDMVRDQIEADYRKAVKVLGRNGNGSARKSRKAKS